MRGLGSDLLQEGLLKLHKKVDLPPLDGPEQAGRDVHVHVNDPLLFVHHGDIGNEGLERLCRGLVKSKFLKKNSYYYYDSMT